MSENGMHGYQEYMEDLGPVNVENTDYYKRRTKEIKVQIEDIEYDITSLEAQKKSLLNYIKLD